MKSPKIAFAAAASLALVTTGCITDPNTGEKTYSRAGVLGAGGALAGYLLGGLIGGKTARIVGAGVGGVAGAVVGSQIDKQIKELKEQTAGSGVDVEEIDGQNAILVRLPDGVTFATGQYTIQPGFYDSLNSVAQSLKDYPNSLIDVLGFTDTVGTASSNQVLSERRAQAVADYLVRQGIDRRRIETKGYGEQQDYLRIKTGDEVNEPLNRRVEIKITTITQEEVNAAGN